jgi:Sec-independent protein translocase protein TatA
MFGVGLPELAVLAVLAFGPDKLPEFARQAGRLVRRVQEFTQATREELRHEIGDLELDELSAFDWDSATRTGPGSTGSAISSSGGQQRPKEPGAAKHADHMTAKPYEPSDEGPGLRSETHADGSSLTSPRHESNESEIDPERPAAAEPTGS